MRLKDQLRVLREAEAVLAVERNITGSAPIAGNQANTLHGTRAADLRRALERVRNVPAVERAARRILEIPALASAGDDAFPAAAIGTNEISNLQAQLLGLLGQVRVLIAGFEPFAPDEPEHVLTVTLPPDVVDLTGFERFIGHVQEGVEQPALLVIGDKPSLLGVDRGSIELILGMSAAVYGFTRLLIAACERALREKERVRATQKHLESLGLLNDELVTSMVETQRDYRQALAKEIDQGYDGHHPTGHNPHEVQARLLKSMETLMGLVERGTKLQLQATAETKESPGIEEKILEKLPEVATKLLAAKAGTPDAE
jgi:hypothetical protein